MLFCSRGALKIWLVDILLQIRGDWTNMTYAYFGFLQVFFMLCFRRLKWFLLSSSSFLEYIRICQAFKWSTTTTQKTKQSMALGYCFYTWCEHQGNKNGYICPLWWGCSFHGQPHLYLPNIWNNWGKCGQIAHT